MAQRPKFNLPADCPTDWTDLQILSANGAPEGDVKHGYNYLSQQVNRAQECVNILDEEQTHLLVKDLVEMNPGEVYAVNLSGEMELFSFDETIEIDYTEKKLSVAEVVRSLYRSDHGLVIVTNKGTQTVLQLNLNVWRPNMVYSTGDIVYSQYLKSYEYLECTAGGVTASTFSDTIKNMVIGGIRVKESVPGGCTWRKRDIRCKHNIGDLVEKANPGSPPAYEYLLPLDGRSLSSDKYELLQLFPNGILPDSRGKVTQHNNGGQVNGSIIQAGLPNISGKIGNVLTCKEESEPAEVTGVFSGSIYGSSNYGEGVEVGGAYAPIRFDASQSNGIYGGSVTVQPPALVVTRYICFG